MYFYPRSPCGERPSSMFLLMLFMVFLSTLSLRRATLNGIRMKYFSAFLSTLSLRRATAKGSTVGGAREISIHALLAESDNLRVVDGSKSSIISIHALLAESDLLILITGFLERVFLSTLSLRRATPSANVRSPP